MLRKRTVYLLLVLVSIFLSLSLLYQPPRAHWLPVSLPTVATAASSSSSPSAQAPLALGSRPIPSFSDAPVVATEERFLSYFPHGDLLDQLIAFQNGLRIAQDTNRTLIAPYLRLGRSHGWGPLATLARQYEAQDKDVLRKACKGNKTSDVAWQLKYEPCDTLADWTEVPWSMVFDLSFLQHQRVRLIERPDHDWRQVNGAPVLSTRLLLVDPDPKMAQKDQRPTAENLTDNNGDFLSSSWWQAWWQRIKAPQRSQLGQKQRRSVEFSSFSSSSSSSSSSTAKQEQKQEQKQDQGPEKDDNDVPLVTDSPVTTTLLRRSEAMLIQCGSLADGALFRSSKTPEEHSLLDAFAMHMVPSHLPSLKQTAGEISRVLGGSRAYVSIHLHWPHMLQRELDLRTSDFVVQSAAAASSLNTDELTSVDMASDLQKVMRQLGPAQMHDMAQYMMLQLSSDLSIAPAVSSALPVNDASQLATYLRDASSHAKKTRRQWMQACTDYRRHYDKRYPILYLTTDVPIDAQTLPFWQMLLDQYPCTFTQQELIDWHLVEKDWSATAAMGLDPIVDHNKLLAPLLDMLVASQAYSLVELPTNTLIFKIVTRYRRHQKTN
ncbi:hypothetical protein BC940DRAFT_306794 [Gongronella butleri]|nr:hypothetical protein BC940DRAFT_306794 [Gongronella butleri]